MEVVQSHDYSKILKLDVDQVVAPEEVIDRLEIEQERAETLKYIQSATGLTFDVVVGGADPHMAACIDTRTKKTYIRQEMLDPEHRAFALYAARHEKEHAHNGFFELDMKKHLSEDQRKTLGNALGIDDVAGINWVEGFNDFITASKYGKNEQSGYNAEEVPAAMKLEQLVQKEMNFSLKEAFDQGNEELFFERLEKLCQSLMHKQYVEEIMADPRQQRRILQVGLNVEQAKTSVLEKIQSFNFELDDKEKTLDALQKLLDEEIQIALVRSFFGKGEYRANDNADAEVA